MANHFNQRTFTKKSDQTEVQEKVYLTDRAEELGCVCPGYLSLLGAMNKFPDGTEIRDSTEGKIASVIAERVGRNQKYAIYIALNGHKVIRQGTGGYQLPETLWGQPYGTDHIEIKDSSDHPGQIIITEYKKNGKSKTAIVDTHKKYHRHFTDEFRRPELVYITEDVIPKIDPKYFTAVT